MLFTLKVGTIESKTFANYIHCAKNTKRKLSVNNKENSHSLLIINTIPMALDNQCLFVFTCKYFLSVLCKKGLMKLSDRKILLGLPVDMYFFSNNFQWCIILVDTLFYRMNALFHVSSRIQLIKQTNDTLAFL